jgi:nicotinamidase-related amidase
MKHFGYETAALLIVDVQQGLDEPSLGKRNNPQAETCMAALLQSWREAGITQLVVVGLTTDHCVSATTRMASDLGFDVTLASDATAAFGRDGFDGKYYSADEIHRVNLVSLDGEFCRGRSTAEITGNIG